MAPDRLKWMVNPGQVLGDLSAIVPRKSFGLVSFRLPDEAHFREVALRSVDVDERLLLSMKSASPMLSLNHGWRPGLFGLWMENGKMTKTNRSTL